MAQPPPGVLPARTPFSQSLTLFLPSPGIEGILVRRIGRRETAEPMQFDGSQAALALCEKNRASLIYYFDAIPAFN